MQFSLALLRPVIDAGATGQQNAVAVNLYRVDATDADAKAIVIARYSEVIGAHLTFEATVDDAAKKAAKAVQLASAGIIVR